MTNPASQPTAADRALVADYAAQLKGRGFCAIDDESSNQTRLLNRFNGAKLPLSW